VNNICLAPTSIDSRISMARYVHYYIVNLHAYEKYENEARIYKIGPLEVNML